MINLLDCTLRDGGWANEFLFGRTCMRDIERTLIGSGVEYIELGYLDIKEGSAAGRSMYSSWEAPGLIFQGIQREASHRLVMVDYGKYPVSLLPDNDGKADLGFEGIRLCFHKKDKQKAMESGRIVLDKGYRLFVQPMIATRYNSDEQKRLIEDVLRLLPDASAFYVVDSFGRMDEAEVRKRLETADRLLPSEMALGLHTHDNRRLCFQNAKAAAGMDAAEKRELILDCSLSGMGKGPGNLMTEEFAEFLNYNLGKQYDADRIRQLAKRRIQHLRKKLSWGYKQQYELTAKYHATPTYAKKLCEENGFTLAELEEFLSGMPEEEKDSYNSQYMETYISRRRSQ